MQKRIIGHTRLDHTAAAPDCLDLERVAAVEVTSESAEHPVEAALLPGQSQGWRAGEPGRQTIRLLFDQPQAIRGIELVFLENAIRRTQEYVVRISSDHGQSFVEIVRQQWNFHPQGGEREVERHMVDAPAVTTVEVNITPDMHDPGVYASLEKLQLF